MSTKAWNDFENASIVQLYLFMLDAATAGRKYNKAELIRQTQHFVYESGVTLDGPLVNRSRASIEFKLMNLSAAHASIIPGAVTMHGFGYRAMPNYQASLKAELSEALEIDGEIVSSNAA